MRLPQYERDRQARVMEALTNLQAQETPHLPRGDWNDPLRLGGAFLWADANGKLRIKASAPSSDTDGVVVGTQS